MDKPFRVERFVILEDKRTVFNYLAYFQGKYYWTPHHDKATLFNDEAAAEDALHTMQLQDQSPVRWTYRIR